MIGDDDVKYFSSLPKTRSAGGTARGTPYARHTCKIEGFGQLGVSHESVDSFVDSSLVRGLFSTPLIFC